jgi:hypothetical protein
MLTIVDIIGTTTLVGLRVFIVDFTEGATVGSKLGGMVGAKLGSTVISVGEVVG